LGVVKPLVEVEHMFDQLEHPVVPGFVGGVMQD
jgi:hypothetical protein